MLATLVVNSDVDGVVDLSDDVVTLRDAIHAANNDVAVSPGGPVGSAADTILFDANLAGGTILLDGTELEITEALVIDAGALASGVTIDALQNSRVLNFSAVTGDLNLNRLTITGGQTTGDSSYGLSTFSGGGIRFVSSGTLTLTNSEVSGNLTQGLLAEGGGIFASSGAIALIDSTVSGNAAGDDILDSVRGGGVFAGSGSVILTGSIISSNSSIESGGGMAAVYGDVTLIDSIVSGNSIDGEASHGGGIYVRAGAVTLTGSTVSGNTSTGGELTRGAGIASITGDVMLADSTVSDNLATGASPGGGGIYSNSGTVTLSGSTLSGNRAEGFGATGGGTFSYSGAVTFSNSTLSGNRAEGPGSYGGGLFVQRTSVLIESSTVTGNDATGEGGGIVFSSNSGFNESLTIRDSIIAGNVDNGTAPELQIVDPANDLIVTFSLIGDNAGTSLPESQEADTSGNLIGSVAGGGIIAPFLEVLADNDGGTLTHALLPGSPALNAGNPTAAAGAGQCA